jgi:hypothetical protein
MARAKAGGVSFFCLNTVRVLVICVGFSGRVYDPQALYTNERTVTIAFAGDNTAAQQ